MDSSSTSSSLEDTQSTFSYYLITPGACIVLVICVGFWWWSYKHWKNALDFGHIPVIAFSYENVIHKKEYWRAITASFSHLNFEHLLANMYSLWESRLLEHKYGLEKYLSVSVLLLVLSMLGLVLSYHCLIYYFNHEIYLQKHLVGYSSVLFGLMTLEALEVTRNVTAWGFSIPAVIGPIYMLVYISYKSPNASFLAHFWGIVAGLIIHWGWFDWLEGLSMQISILGLALLVFSLTKVERKPPPLDSSNVYSFGAHEGQENLV